MENWKSKTENPVITGDRLRLRPLTEADLPLRVQWYNDPDIRRTLLVDEVFTLEGTRKWFARIQEDASRLDWMIETSAGMSIGLISLLHIDPKNKTAEIIIVIGDRAYWGRGVMAEAEALLIGWAFEKLLLEKIWAVALPGNLASLITMKKLGFVIEGTLRGEAVKDGRRTDLFRLGLLKDEFKNSFRSPAGRNNPCPL